MASHRRSERLPVEWGKTKKDDRRRPYRRRSLRIAPAKEERSVLFGGGDSVVIEHTIRLWQDHSNSSGHRDQLHPPSGTDVEMPTRARRCYSIFQQAELS